MTRVVRRPAKAFTQSEARGAQTGYGSPVWWQRVRCPGHVLSVI